MHRLRRMFTAGFATLAALAGCASVDPRADYQRVREQVQAATGVGVEPPADEAAVRPRLDELLRDGLTSAEALEFCLLNNPRVRAAYLSVGVARADVVQAGLLQNPGVSLALRLPDGGGLTNLELSIAQNIAELWLIPVRQRAAAATLEGQVLEAARAIGGAALDTRVAYFEALAAERGVEIARENRSLAQQLVELTLARQSAGVGSEIDVNLARTERMQTEIAEQNAALAAFDARRRLLSLLGLSATSDVLLLVDSLPAPHDLVLPEADLLSAAERSRLDLVAAGQAVAAAEARVQQERLSIVSRIELGASLERSARGRRGDRPWLADTLWASAEAGELTAPALRPREPLPSDAVLGPTLSLELPIFDQNQAQIARAELLYQAALADQAALLLDVTHETRTALRRAQTAASLAAFYRDKFLPLAQTNLDLAREAYRGGKLSLLAVLEAQQALLAARGRYVEAQRAGVIALTELERAVGLPFARLRQLGAAPAPSSQASESK